MRGFRVQSAYSSIRSQPGNSGENEKAWGEGLFKSSRVGSSGSDPTTHLTRDMLSLRVHGNGFGSLWAFKITVIRFGEVPEVG